MNEIEIVVNSKDKSDLDKVGEKAKRAGKEIGESIKKGTDEAEKSTKDATVKMNAAFDGMARDVAKDLDRMESKAWESGQGMDKATAAAVAGMRAELDKIRTAAAKSGDSLDSELGEALRNVRDEAKKTRVAIDDALDPPKSSGFGDALDGMMSGISGSMGNVGGMLEGGISAAKGGLLAAGTAAAGFIMEGIQAEIQEDKVGALLAAQTGAATSAAEGLGNAAGEVFADNFGESIDQVGEAMAAIFANKLIDTTAPQGEIEDLTAKVLTLSQVTGESFEGISQAAARMVRTGIADNVSQAMDLIGAAAQHGLNSSEDLIDSIIEYSTKFRDLGLNGKEAFGLIEQAMDGGARNTDVAADALKEFAIRAQDASVTTRRGFESIGLDADKMGAMVARGGDSAKEALRQTLNALSAMPAGVARSTAAVDLFGTKAEDLGQSLYDMDLDDAADKFKKFGGTVDDMAKKISEGTSFWDKLGKGISNAAGAVGEFLDKDFSEMLDDMPELKDRLEEVNQAQQKFLSNGDTSALDALAEKYPDLAGKINDYIAAQREEGEATAEANAEATTYVETLDKLIGKKQEAAGVILDMADADMNYQEALDAATKSIEDNGATLDTTTEKGRNNRQALDEIAQSALDMAEAMSNNGATVNEVNGYLESAGMALVDTGTKMGWSKDQAVAYGIQLGLIPNTVSTYMNLLGYDYAAARAIQFKQFLDRIPPEKVITLRVSAQGGGHYFADAHGGIVAQQPWGAASGGQRHSSTVINEAGPELVELPSGARVATAGATRAMAEAGWLGGGGGTPVVAQFVVGGPTDDLGRAIVNWLQKYTKNEHGGNVASALGQRTGA